MKLKVSILLFLFLFMANMKGFAHVTNESTIYDDIEFSRAKEQILLLRGLNIIPYESGIQLYRPQDKLKREDLAKWSVKFHGLADEGQEEQSLKELAVKHGFIDSLNGDATFGDVIIAYFYGELKVENENEEITREEFALFIGKHLYDEIQDETLFAQAGFVKGPSGLVEEVYSERIGEAETSFDAFQIVIEGQPFQLHHHPKILNASTDARDWVGHTIVESWYKEGDEKELEIVILNEHPFKSDLIERGDEVTEDVNSNMKVEEVNMLEQAETTRDIEKEEIEEFSVIIWICLIALIVIGIWLFLRRKK